MEVLYYRFFQQRIHRVVTDIAKQLTINRSQCDASREFCRNIVNMFKNARVDPSQSVECKSWKLSYARFFCGDGIDQVCSTIEYSEVTCRITLES